MTASPEHKSALILRHVRDGLGASCLADPGFTGYQHQLASTCKHAVKGCPKYVKFAFSPTIGRCPATGERACLDHHDVLAFAGASTGAGATVLLLVAEGDPPAVRGGAAVRLPSGNSSCDMRSTKAGEDSAAGSRHHCTSRNFSGTRASVSRVPSMAPGTRNALSAAIKFERSIASFHSRRK